MDKNFKSITCECGSTEFVSVSYSTFKCKFCNKTYINPDASNTVQRKLEQAEANIAYNIPHFDEAYEIYDSIIKEDSTYSHAYWGKLLSLYGIKIMTDRDGSKKPVCFKRYFAPIKSNPLFEKAIKYASEDKKEEYNKLAEQIDVNLGVWKSKIENGPKYDVFIAYCETDPTSGNRTEDSRDVEEIYYNLKEKGFKVFLSSKCIGNDSRAYYEPIIYDAIQNASSMIVYGSKAEFFESSWVKNEWARFSYRIEKEHQNLYLNAVVKGDINVHLLPDYFQHTNFFKREDIRFFEKLVSELTPYKGLNEKIIRRGKQARVVTKQTKTIQYNPQKIEQIVLAKTTSGASKERQQEREIKKNNRILPNEVPTISGKLVSADSLLVSGSFISAFKVYAEILGEDNNNVKAKYGSVLAQKNRTKIGDFTKNDFFSLTDEEIQYIVDMAQYHIEKKAQNEANAIFNQLCTFAAGISSSYTKDQFEKVDLVINLLAPFNDVPCVSAGLLKVIKVIMSLQFIKSSKVFNKLVVDTVSALPNSNVYIEKLIELIDQFLLSNKEITNELLEQYHKYYGEDYYYIIASLKVKNHSISEESLLQNLADNKQFDELDRILKSCSNEKDLNSFFKIIYRRLRDNVECFDQVKNPNDILDLANYIFKYPYVDRTRQLEIVTEKAIKVSDANANDLVTLLIKLAYVESDSYIAKAARYIEARVNNQVKLNQYSKINTFIDDNAYFLRDELKWVENKLLYSFKVSNYKDLNHYVVKDIYLFDLETIDSLFNEFLSLCQSDNKLLKHYCEFIQCLCSICAYEIKDYLNKKDSKKLEGVFRAFDFFVKQYPEYRNEEFEKSLKEMVEECIRYRLFDIATPYCTELLTLKKCVEYYYLALMIEAKHATLNEFGKDPVLIVDRDAWKSIFQIYRKDVSKLDDSIIKELTAKNAEQEKFGKSFRGKLAMKMRKGNK